MTKMDLYRMANEIAARENSRYRDICRDRTKLFEFMASNEWFDLLDIMPDDADAVISKGNRWSLMTGHVQGLKVF